MFRHVAVFRWAEGTTSDAIERLQQALAELPSSIQELRGYRTGPDAGLREGNWDFAVVADFDDVAGWRASGAATMFGFEVIAWRSALGPA